MNWKEETKKQKQEGNKRKQGRFLLLSVLLVLLVLTGCTGKPGNTNLPNPGLAEHNPNASLEPTGSPDSKDPLTAPTKGLELPGENTGSGESPEPTNTVPQGEQPQTEPEQKFVILLDPGHGAKWTGACYNDKVEKELNLKIAQYAKAYLEEQYNAFTVYMTREDDTILDKDLATDLKRRVEMAGELQADILVSLHLNASEGHNQHGAAVYCPHRENVKEESFRLANCILAELENLGIKNNGAQKRSSNDTFDADGNPVEYYAINRYAADFGLAGVIVEHCFMDNETDTAFLADEEALQALGEADARGIAAYFGY